MIDRRPRDDRYLEWKVWVFCLAAVLGLGGIFLDTRWLTGVAIALLGSVMLLRFLPGGGRVGLHAEDAEDEDTESADPVSEEAESEEAEETESGM